MSAKIGFAVGAVGVAMFAFGLAVARQFDDGAPAPSASLSAETEARLAALEASAVEAVKSDVSSQRELQERMDRLEAQLARISSALEERSLTSHTPRSSSRSPEELRKTTRERLQRLATNDAKYAVERTETLERLQGTKRFNQDMLKSGPLAMLSQVVDADLDRTVDAFLESELKRMRKTGVKFTTAQEIAYEELARAYWPKIVKLQQKRNHLVALLRDNADAPPEDRKAWTARSAEILQMAVDLQRTLAVRTKDEVFSE